MQINLKILDYNFLHKPLIIGGKAMEYYGLRKAGLDIDLVIHSEDHTILKIKYPNNIKDLYGDIGICEYGFEIWNQICTFGYEYLKMNAIEEKEYIIISLEKLWEPLKTILKKQKIYYTLKHETERIF